MANWKQKLANIGVNIEEQFDDLKFRLGSRLGLHGEPLILPYLGHATPDRIYMKGRLLADKGLKPAEEFDTLWQNLLQTYRRMESDEIPHASLMAYINGQATPLQTDEEGYFTLDMLLDAPLSPDHWLHGVDFHYQPEEGEVVQTTGNAILPPAHAEFGIISDIDDTVLVSHATQLLKAVRLMMLHNARMRLPFAGVPAFYRALQKQQQNPIFYVSSSPWNLYDLLTDFLQINDIPAGPLFLRDYGFDEHIFATSDHHAHKLTQIRHLLDFYPDLSFILIGDSGQQDPEIYQTVVQEYPGRILGIYIRDVSQDERDAEVDLIVRAMSELGVPMVYVPDTVVAAEHAVQMGWIAAEEMPAIRADKLADESAPTALEAIVDDVMDG